jgi:acetyl esterase/lipase
MAPNISRRDFAKWSIVFGSGTWCLARSYGQTSEMHSTTYAYKTVGDLAIKADVIRAADELVRPVLVWIHGGALIMGDRRGIDRHIKQHALSAGYVLVSLDYRLAPETKLPEIIADLEDAFRWIRREGPRLFHAAPDRLAVVGGSAGGYLTLTSGYRVKPQPQALLALYGYGDLIGDWYSKPSPHPRHHHSHLSREEAYRQVSGPPIAESHDRHGNGGAFYEYCRQTGTWPQAVSGWNPQKEADRFSPFMPIKNVTADYPPTVLVHGTKDTDVPYEQSSLMAERLQQAGIPHKLITVKDAEHGLDGADAKVVDAAYAEALAFVDERLQKK